MHADKRVVALGLSNKFEAERDYVFERPFHEEKSQSSIRF
jgi:hypothetical protein